MTTLTSAPRRASDLDGIVCCAIGSEEYALKAADAKFVARAEQMTLPPVALEGPLVGTVQYRETAVPVYSLAALFGRPAARPLPDHHIVVTGGATSPMGLLVDRLVRIADVHEAEMLALPAAVGPVAQRWFQGLLRLGDRAMLVIAPSSLDPTSSAASASTPIAAVGSTAAYETAAAGSDSVAIFSSRALPPIEAARYAVGARRVAAVLQALPLITLPGHAPAVSALACWRGAAVPVLDFAGDRSRDAVRPRERYLIVRAGAQFARTLIAFVVGDDLTLHQASREDRSVAATEPTANFIRGMYGVSGESVALVDPDALLALAASAAPSAAARVA